MLSPIEFLRPALDIPYGHHEKWDGTGYPRGLKGEEIPLAARLFAVVDVWDALRSDRPYRPAWPCGATRDHIASLSGTHFDPQVVSVFLEIVAAESPGRRTLAPRRLKTCPHRLQIIGAQCKYMGEDDRTRECAPPARSVRPPRLSGPQDWRQEKRKRGRIEHKRGG